MCRKLELSFFKMKENIAFSSVTGSLVIGGIYEHYKNKRYKILAIARHSETLQEMVVYQALYGEGSIWVRPAEMFMENVSIDGKFVARFKLVQESN